MFESLFFNEHLLNDQYKFGVFDFLIFGILLIITFFYQTALKFRVLLKKFN